MTALTNDFKVRNSSRRSTLAVEEAVDGKIPSSDIGLNHHLHTSRTTSERSSIFPKTYGTTLREKIFICSLCSQVATTWPLESLLVQLHLLSFCWLLSWWAMIRKTFTCWVPHYLMQVKCCRQKSRMSQTKDDDTDPEETWTGTRSTPTEADQREASYFDPSYDYMGTE